MLQCKAGGAFTLADGMEVNVMKGEPMHSNSLPLFDADLILSTQSIYQTITEFLVLSPRTGGWSDRASIG